MLKSAIVSIILSLSQISLFAQDLELSPKYNPDEVRKSLKIKDNQTRIRNGIPRLGMIVKCLDDKNSLDSLVSYLDKDVKIVTSDGSKSQKRWKDQFYESISYGEVFWSLENDAKGTFRERLEVWEGGQRVRTILIIRSELTERILGIADVDG